MKVLSAALACSAFVSGLVGFDRRADAAPTTADCLSASDASLKANGEHRLRAERAQLLICASPTCPAEIRKECISRVEEVNSAIPTITFEAKDDSGNDVSAVRVMMDGEVLTDRLDGMSLSVDPGAHAFTFEAEGEPLIRKQFVIHEGQKDRSEAIVFATAKATPTPTSLETAPAIPPPPPPRPVDSGLGAQKGIALVAVGIGLGGLGVGTAFGVLALTKRNDAQKACPTQCATQDGVNMWADAKTSGSISTIAFIAGGATVAAGLVLWLTAGGGGPPRAEVGVGPGAIQVRGWW